MAADEIESVELYSKTKFVMKKASFSSLPFRCSSAFCNFIDSASIWSFCLYLNWYSLSWIYFVRVLNEKCFFGKLAVQGESYERCFAQFYSAFWFWIYDYLACIFRNFRYSVTVYDLRVFRRTSLQCDRVCVSGLHLVSNLAFCLCSSTNKNMHVPMNIQNIQC